MLRAKFAPLVDLEVVGEAANGAAGVEMLGRLGADLVVLDLEMPGMRGDQAIPLMRIAAPDVRIIVFSASPDVTIGSWTITQSPDRVVTKGSPLAELVAQMRRAMQPRGPVA